MKRLLIIFLVLIASFAMAQEDTPLVEKWHTFKGAWMPDADPAQIGPENFKTLQNMRYNTAGIEGVQGYTAVNSTALTGYLKIRNGFQLRSEGYTQETYNLVQAENTGLTASQVLVNKTAIGSQGDFEATEIQTDGTGAGLGRFSEGPQGVVVYSNGVENKVWAGDETRCAKVFRAALGETGTGYTPGDMRFADRGTDDYINTETGDFHAAGFKAGDTIAVTNATEAGNNDTFTVDHVEWSWLWFMDDRLYLSASDALTNEGANANATVTVTEGTAYTTIVDFTDELNSSATSEYADVGGSDPDTFMVLSTRPLKGIKFYVGTANTTTATLAVKYWNGSAWTAVANGSDGTTTDSKAFAKTGTYSFDSTVSTAKLYHAEQTYYLYAYTVTLSAGSADIYQITCDAPWQDLTNVWDGVDRQPIAFQVWDNSEDTYYDYTVEVNTEANTTAYGVAELDGMTTSDHVIVAFEEAVSAVRWQMFQDYVNKNIASFTIHYYDGDDYTTVGTVFDETVEDRFYGADTLAQSGITWWNPPSDETIKSEFGVTGYFYKLVPSATLTGTTGDATAELVVNHVWGVPATIDVKKFKFSSDFNNRVLLCNYELGGEGNRVDYSVSNAPDVWNGVESSMDGVQSLYFGGNSPLTAGTQLYNRFGSNIFVTWVALKRNETYLLTGTGPEDFSIKPISFNVGCPAPLTLATAEIGFDMAQDVTRNIAIWLSADGLIVFDGAVINFVKGIDKYFDATNADCINYSSIANSRGWFDPEYKEYNLLIPTGSSTTCDTWLVYSLIYKKWFEKVPDTYPQAAWQVASTVGEKSIYGAIDTGYMLELEDGTAWVDDPIEQIVETGDFFPTGNIWDLTRIRMFKFAGKRINEAHSIVVSHYSDTDDAVGMDGIWVDTDDCAWVDTEDCEWVSASLASMELSLDAGINRVVRDTIKDNLYGWAHRFQFYTTTASTSKGLEPIAWGYTFRKVRRDE